MSEIYRVVDFFADLLVLEGIDCVFTVPGGTAVPLLEAISRKPSIRVVVAKDEAGAAFAADGYAWACGKPGVVVTIGGPGATNALTGLCCSSMQGHSVLLVSGEVGSQAMGRGAVQDGTDLGLDVLDMSRPATVLSVSAASAEKAPFALLEALRRVVALGKPVHVSLPLDVQTSRTRQTCPGAPEEYRALVTAGCDGVALGGAARLLRESKRTAILLGSGARHAAREALALAEVLGAPVATTCGAKGVFPEDHPLSIGVFSFGSGPLAREILSGELDVLCAVGTRLGEFSSMNFARSLQPTTALIHIDRDPRVFGRSYRVFPVYADASIALSELRRRVPEPPDRELPAWFARARARTPRVADEVAMASSQRPLRPERVMRAVQATLPKDACVLSDIGTSCLFTAHYLKLRPPQRCYIPMAWSCMGHPLAASIGARIGSGKPTLCVAGDAAFLAKGLELHAAVEGRLGRLVWVVLTNRGHGLVRFGTEKLLGPDHGVEAGDFRTQPSAADVARALGAGGLVVEDPEHLEPALFTALEADRPFVLDVRVDPGAEPPMADRIQGLRDGAGLGGTGASR